MMHSHFLAPETMQPGRCARGGTRRKLNKERADQVLSTARGESRAACRSPRVWSGCSSPYSATNDDDPKQRTECDDGVGDENDGFDAAHANTLFMLRPIAIPSGSCSASQMRMIVVMRVHPDD